MIKYTETYTDFFGNERTEDVYFNLTSAELTEMEMGTTGGLSTTLRNIIASKDLPTISEYFKKLLLISYGEISPDGRRFIKNKELSTAFEQTQIFSNIYIRLLDADEAFKFIKGIMPNDLASKIDDMAVKKEVEALSDIT